jgi:hypothetical protein
MWDQGFNKKSHLLLLVIGAKNVMLLPMLLMSVSCTHVYHKVTDHRACYAPMPLWSLVLLQHLLKEHTWNWKFFTSHVCTWRTLYYWKVRKILLHVKHTFEVHTKLSGKRKSDSLLKKKLFIILCWCAVGSIHPCFIESRAAFDFGR